MSAFGRKAYILSYRRGSNAQYESYMIIEVDGVGSRREAAQMVGRKVVWKSPDGKLTVVGTVVRPHGNKGRVLVRFRKPLSGQAIGSVAYIL